jgi:glycosyltransferase involved in cell wall biosynthesis
MDERATISDSKECILALTGAYNLSGGIAAVNRLVLRALAADGRSSDVYVLNEPLSNHLPEGFDGSINSYSTYGGDKLAFVRALWRALAKKRGSFIFCDHANLAAALAPWRFILGMQYAVWLHGIEVMPPKPDLEGKIGLRGAWRCLCSSQFTQDLVKASFPGLPLTACDLALDYETLPPLPNAANAGQLEQISLRAVNGSQSELSGQVILHVGRMNASERYKGQDVLIDAFPRVADRFPEAQLVLVGDGDDRQNLLARAVNLPVDTQKKVFLTGQVSKELLDRLYRSCYLFAMPSKGEGFGIVYLEAMARGKACLGGSVDAARCVIHDGVSGLLVDDPESPEEVAGKICWMLERPQAAQQMGLAGYELVRSNYLLPHFKDRFWKALAD